MQRSDESEIKLIDNNERLSDLCLNLSSIDLIALDTEFVRTSTFYGDLGLIQLCDGPTCYLIDPIEINNW